jgi:hypothetical protein
MMSGWANHIEPTRGTRQTSIWPELASEASTLCECQAYPLHLYAKTLNASIRFRPEPGQARP